MWRTELDPVSQRRLTRGAIIIELLKQPQFVTYSFVDQTLMLFTLKENLLDKLDLTDVRLFAVQFVSYVKSIYPQLYDALFKHADISKDLYNQLMKIAKEFSKVFVSTIH